MDTYENLEYHIHNQLAAENFIQNYEGKKKFVPEQLFLARRGKLWLKERFLPTVKTVVFCGTQGLVLPGHCDSGSLSEERQHDNDGSF